MNKTISLDFREVVKIDGVETIPNSNDKFVAYGQNNDYPQQLIGLYESDGLLASIIDTISTYIMGDGLTIKEDKVINKKGEIFRSLISRVIIDYITTGAFAVQVCRNVYGDVNELYYVKVENVRLNEDGSRVFYKRDWSKRGKEIVYKANDNSASTSIYYFRNPKTRGVYGKPYWSACINDILTDIEISKYNLNTVTNSFTPSALINLCGEEPDEDSKKAIKRDFENRFTGANNASGIIINFVADQEHRATIDSFDADSNSDRYLNMRDTARENIMNGCRIQPILLGSIESSAGFSAVEFSGAFKLFQRTVVSPLQRDIESAFASITQKAGTEHPFDFKFKEFVVHFDSEQQ